MIDKNNINQIEKSIKKNKVVAMVAPSYIADFSYPEIILQLKKLGFDKVVELTFGAKMINRDYQKILRESNELVISSVCPRIVDMVKNNFPEYEKNLIKVDSPMIAMGKICRKYFPKHKICFISPCHFKKIEASRSKYVDYVIDYVQLAELFEKNKIKSINKKGQFDKFYNDYTKIYPLSGGLYKTAKLHGIIGRWRVKLIDSWSKVERFLKKPKKRIKFLDVNFCEGGCIGGPCFNNKLSIRKRKRMVKKYLRQSKKEDIPERKKGLIKNAEGISFLIKK